jgi:hypothetical protein
MSLISFLWMNLIRFQTDYIAVFHPLVDLIVSGLELTAIVFISLFIIAQATKDYHLLRLINILRTTLVKLVNVLYKKHTH